MNLLLWFSFPFFQLNGLHVMHVCWAAWLKSIPGFIDECVKIQSVPALLQFRRHEYLGAWKFKFKMEQVSQGSHAQFSQMKLLICEFGVLIFSFIFTDVHVTCMAWFGCVDCLSILNIIIIWQYISTNFVIADSYFTRWGWTCLLRLYQVKWLYGRMWEGGKGGRRGCISRTAACIKLYKKTMDLQPYGRTKFSKMSWFKITVKAIVINNHCFYCSILFLFFYWELIFFQQRALQGALQVKCCRNQQSPEQPGYVNRTEMKLILGKKLCWIRQFRYVKIYTWLRDHISVVLLSKPRSQFWIFICQ